MGLVNNKGHLSGKAGQAAAHCPGIHPPPLNVSSTLKFHPPHYSNTFIQPMATTTGLSLQPLLPSPRR